MLEKEFRLTKSNQKIVEKVIIDENIHYNHMIMPKGEGLPLHKTNSNVYMTVLRGILTISLGEEVSNEYESGTILKIPNGVGMYARNENDEVLEITVIKAPAPKNIK
ncbi:MAG TPA: cupin domain-containing protein [Clostridia bacterium]|nr:cupin domain-containing protein [Clostridia bacterium]